MHIFLTGPTGYIGGSVLARLLSHSVSDTFQITVLVRSPDKAIQFRKMGIQAVVGSLSDFGLLQDLSSRADVTVSCADADNLDAVRAILRGQKQRYEANGQAPCLIHTSGTGVLIDDAQGDFASEKIYSDLDIPSIEALAPTQPHRLVDLTIVEADTQGYVKTYIVLPCTIYGRACGPLVDAGLQNPRSIQIPMLASASLARGRAGVFGKGANIWNNVHISELASLYILLIDLIMLPNAPRDSDSPSSIHARESKSPLSHDTPLSRNADIARYFAHGREGYYFAESGEHDMISIARAIGRCMVELGKAADPMPAQFTPEEVIKYFNGHTAGFATNSRSRADRARKLGWNPEKTTKDLLASIMVEVKGA